MYFVINIAVQTEYKELSSYWTPRQGTGADYFTISVYMSIPPQKVVHKPSAAQTIKFAWIQYLSMIIPAWWLITILRNYLFANQIVESHVVVQKVVENLSGNQISNLKLKKNL